MTERKQIRRKYDPWKVPGIVVSIITVLGVIGVGAMWVQAQNKDVESCVADIHTNKQHIVILEQNTAEIQAALLVNTNTLMNIDRSVTKMATKQDKDNDKVEQRLEKLTDLVIKLIQNGDGHP